MMEKRLVIPDRSSSARPSLDLLTPPHIPTRSSSKRDNLVRKLETLNQSVESLKTLVETGKRGQTELEWVREDIKQASRNLCGDRQGRHRWPP
jgi:hypothetical protein